MKLAVTIAIGAFAAHNAMAGMAASETVFEILQGDPDLSTAAGLVVTAGFSIELDNVTAGPFDVEAPTNDAFTAFWARTGETLLGLEANEACLVDLVQLHINNGAASARRDLASVPATNGNVDTVAAVKDDSIIAKAQSLGLTALVDQINAAGLAGTFGTPCTNVTLFAPSNAAFANLARPLSFLTRGVANEDAYLKGLLVDILQTHLITTAVLTEADILALLSACRSDSDYATFANFWTAGGDDAFAADVGASGCGPTLALSSLPAGISCLQGRGVLGPDTCLECYRNQALCSFPCASQCVSDPASAGCVACVEAEGCYDGFFRCSGFDLRSTRRRALDTDAGAPSALIAANGKVLDISTASGGIVTVGGAVLLDTDTKAGLSLMHGIDTVLLPNGLSTNTIAEAVAQIPSGATFRTALQLVPGLAGLLDSPQDHSWTLFIPTDEAFLAALAQLDVPAGELSENAALIATLLNAHVVEAGLFEADLGETVTTRGGEEIQVSSIQFGNIITNARAINGVIHVIDNVIIPSLTSPPSAAAAVECHAVWAFALASLAAMRL